MKNNLTCIEKMPRKKRADYYVVMMDILSWTVIIIAVIYFTPICWRIFTR